MLLPSKLTFILPIYNVERSLVDQVHRLLDWLPELTSQFEILLIDDGSEDHTCELADELSNEYPQIRVVRHGAQRGLEGIIETAFARSRGETLLLQQPGVALNYSDLHLVWQQSRLGDEASQRSVKAATKSSLIAKLSRWGAALLAENAGRSVRVLIRPQTAQLPPRLVPQSFMAHLKSLAMGDQ